MKNTGIEIFKADIGHASMGGAVHLERLGSEFGFLILWKVIHSWADFKVLQIGSYEDDGSLYFSDKDDGCSMPYQLDLPQATTYLKGHVKFDGCSQIDTPDGLHLCGTDSWENHLALLQYIYHRAFQLMGRDDMDPWKAPLLPMPTATLWPTQ